MVETILLVMLQSAAYGPIAPVAGSGDGGDGGKPGRDVACPPSASGEIVVCKRGPADAGQRVRPMPAIPNGILDADGRLNLRLGKNMQLGGGGPIRQNGQSVGATLRIHF